MAEHLDFAFKAFCCVAALVSIVSLIDSYCRAFRAWKVMR